MTKEEINSMLVGVKMCYALETPEEYILDPLPRGVFEWYTFMNGTETPIQNLLCYKEATQPIGKGQGTDKITLNALYGDNITVLLRIKRLPSDANFLPPRAYRSLVWRPSKFDAIVISENGETVRREDTIFGFTTIINRRGQVLSEEKIVDNLMFKWKSCPSHTQVFTDRGWGRKLEMTKDELWSTRVVNGQSMMSSSDVTNEVYLKGPYEAVTQNGEELTYDGNPCYVRLGE